MKITVPTSWKDVTLRQFIELGKVEALGFDELDSQLRVLSILTGIDDEQFLSISVPELKGLIAKTNFIDNQPKTTKIDYSYKIKGKRYSFDWDASKLIAGEYVDIQNYIKENKNDNLHKVLAVYLKPVTIFGTRKRGCYKKNSNGVWMQTLESRANTSEFLLDNVTMDVVFNMSGFFLNRWQRLMRVTQLYLEKLRIQATREAEEALQKEGFSIYTDGT